MNDRFTVNSSSLPLYREAIYKPVQTDRNTMKKHQANFVVTKDEDGILCAADLEQGIFADGRTERELVEDIKEAVECHFDVSPEEVESKVEIHITGLN